MSYVGPPFKHDVFLSYSHGDFDGSGNSILKQWSQGFARELERELRVLPNIGADIAVFLDQHHRPGQGLDPTSPLTDQLQSQIAASACLAVLMSPHYLRSQWCTEERDWWCRSQDANGLPPSGRIAVARIWPTADPWPNNLCDQHGEPLIGFNFYDKVKAELRPQPFEWPEPNEQSRGLFRDALLELVGRLGINLRELKVMLEERRKQQAEAARLSASGGQVVYLHGRAEQSTAWERAGDALTSKGLVVVPGEPETLESDPKKLDTLRRERVETLTGCDALLLLASPDGRAVDADLVVVGRQDRHSAKARSLKLLPCALLDVIGPPISTPRRQVAARGLQVDWIDATRQDWPGAVQQWLLEASADLEMAQ